VRPIRIALYGDVNLNIIDGSAIWLASLTQVLHRIERTRQTVLRKAPERRDLVTAELAALPRVRLVGPTTGRPLTPAQALDELERLDRAEPFDLLVLRGYALARQAARRPQLAGRLWVYLTDIEQDPAAVIDDDRAELTAIAEASDRLLCQTEQLRGHLEGLTPAAANRTILLPPMVAPAFVDAAAARPARPRRARRLFYAGKFAPGWGVLEMVAAFSRLRARHPDLELHVAGDKVHDPPDDPGFRPAVEAALTGSDGLVWHGGVTRTEVAALLADTDIALSPRDHRLDDSLELSTKVLEYGAAGVPVVCNRTTINAELLGRDYPLFIDAIDDLEAVLDDAVGDDRRWRRAGDLARTVAAGFTYDRVADLLRPHLARRVPDITLPAGRRPRVLVATHDRKFFTAIADHLARCGAQVAFDDWQGHARHDEAVSKELLDRADVVICEWAVGNAVWYSHNVRHGQRLLVRLHRMELETSFPAEVRFDAVERVVVVSELFRDRAVAQLGWPAERIIVVPNWVDTLVLDRPKLPDARFHLGLLGWIPQRKRVDRALDVLERLIRDDDRWRLHLGGPLPWDLRWVWMRLAEREYFTDELDRIRLSPVLRRAVSIDGHLHNVASWLRGIGFVLSPSDDESFHLAPAEGMASGAVPVIWPWVTAAGVYGPRWLCKDAADAAERIASTDWDAERRVAQAYVRRHYPLEQVVDAWADLVLGGRAAL
jgi:glycosyltransferase involved in cell wall biosynthesis